MLPETSVFFHSTPNKLRSSDSNAAVADADAFQNLPPFSFHAPLISLLSNHNRLLQNQGYTRADIASPTGRGRHSIVCRHWLKAMCMKGDFCDFLHQLDYSRMPVCRHYVKLGYCADWKRGICMFKHVRGITEEEQAGEGEIGDVTSWDGSKRESIIEANEYEASSLISTGSQISSASTTHKVSSVECVHYFLGYCSLGPKCWKKHIQRDRSELPEVLPDWFLEKIVLNKKDVFPSIVDQETQKKIQELTNQISSSSSFSPPVTSSPLLSPLVPGLTHADGTPQTVEDVVKFFIIKCNQMTHIYYSVKLGIWATGKANTRKFSEAFKQSDHVILLFSANESGGFQGYGRIMSLPGTAGAPSYDGVWGSTSVKLGGNFRIQWIKQCKVEFEKFAGLFNPLNENLPLKKSRDGTELPLDLGIRICQRLYNSPDENLLAGTHLEQEVRINHSTYFKTLNSEGKLQSRAQQQAILPAHRSIFAHEQPLRHLKQSMHDTDESSMHLNVSSFSSSDIIAADANPQLSRKPIYENTLLVPGMPTRNNQVEWHTNSDEFSAVNQGFPRFQMIDKGNSALVLPHFRAKIGPLGSNFDVRSLQETDKKRAGINVAKNFPNVDPVATKLISNPFPQRYK